MAGGDLTTGNYNLAAGDGAMRKNTTGEYNVVLGSNAGNQFTGTGNSYIGFYSGKDSDTGNYNTAVGYYAFSSNQNGTTSGSYNTAIGYQTLYVVSTGSGNTAVGDQSGYNLTTGSNNLFLGQEAGTASAPAGTHVSASDRIVLGNNSITDAHIKVSFTATSDERDKADITDFTKGLDIINSLRPVTYKWDIRSDYSDDLSVTPDGTHKKEKTEVGLIAQEVETVEKANGYSTDQNNSLFISKSIDGLHYGLKYERLVPVLVNAIKELSAKVTALEAG